MPPSSNDLATPGLQPGVYPLTPQRLGPGGLCDFPRLSDHRGVHKDLTDFSTFLATHVGFEPTFTQVDNLVS